MLTSLYSMWKLNSAIWWHWRIRWLMKVIMWNNNINNQGHFHNKCIVARTDVVFVDLLNLSFRDIKQSVAYFSQKQMLYLIKKFSNMLAAFKKKKNVWSTNIPALKMNIGMRCHIRRQKKKANEKRRGNVREELEMRVVAVVGGKQRLYAQRGGWG